MKRVIIGIIIGISIGAAGIATAATTGMNVFYTKGGVMCAEQKSYGYLNVGCMQVNGHYFVGLNKNAVMVTKDGKTVFKRITP